MSGISVWSPLFPVFPIESRVANVFPLVSCFSYFPPSVSRLFLVFRVGNLLEATSCRVNTIYKETVSIVYSVPSSQCVPDCVRCSFYGLHCSERSLLNPVLLMCSLLFPMCVPIIHSVFPVPLITSVYLCVCAA